jgi:uncharacterized protein (DUF1778 family)
MRNQPFKTTEPKDQSIRIRISTGDQAALRQAATLAELSVSDYIRSHSLAAAKRQGNDQ